MAADGSGLKRRRGTEEPKNSSTYCSTDGAARVYNRSTSNQPKSSIRQRADDCTRVIRQTSALFLCPEGGARLTDGSGGWSDQTLPQDKVDRIVQEDGAEGWQPSQPRVPDGRAARAAQGDQTLVREMEAGMTRHSSG